MIQTLKDNLRNEIKEAVLKCGYIQAEDEFNIILENSNNNLVFVDGKNSTNVAMQLTKLARKNPRMIAEELLNNFNNENANVEKVEIAGPGFINFFMNKNVFLWLYNIYHLSNSCLICMSRRMYINDIREKFTKFLITRICSYLFRNSIVTHPR